MLLWRRGLRPRWRLHVAIPLLRRRRWIVWPRRLSGWLLPRWFRRTHGRWPRLNRRRRRGPVLRRFYARLLLWNRHRPIRLHGRRLSLLNRRRLKRSVLWRRLHARLLLRNWCRSFWLRRLRRRLYTRLLLWNGRRSIWLRRRRLSLLHRRRLKRPVLWRRLYTRLLLGNRRRSVRLHRRSLSLLNHRRLKGPVLRRRLYARLLLWNWRRLHGLCLPLLNRRRCKWPVLRRRTWSWPIRLHGLGLRRHAALRLSGLHLRRHRLRHRRVWPLSSGRRSRARRRRCVDYARRNGPRLGDHLHWRTRNGRGRSRTGNLLLLLNGQRTSWGARELALLLLE